MDIEPGDILRDTTPHPVVGIEGRFQAFIPEAWRIIYAFGGTTMATAIRAAELGLGRDDLRLVTADCTYCQAIPWGPVAMQAEALRQGRGGAQALVRLWALDPDDPDPTGPVRSDLVLTAVFGSPLDSAPDFVGVDPPSVKDPEDCIGRQLRDSGSFTPLPFHLQTDFRMAENMEFWSDPDRPPGKARAASWFRFNASALRDDGTWEPAVLAMPGDILGPSVHAALGGVAGNLFMVSLQIGLQFHHPARTEWILQHSRASVGAGGYASGTAELWDADRTLVATATQSARLRPMNGSLA